MNTDKLKVMAFIQAFVLDFGGNFDELQVIDSVNVIMEGDDVNEGDLSKFLKEQDAEFKFEKELIPNLISVADDLTRKGVDVPLYNIVEYFFADKANELMESLGYEVKEYEPTIALKLIVSVIECAGDYDFLINTSDLNMIVDAVLEANDLPKITNEDLNNFKKYSDKSFIKEVDKTLLRQTLYSLQNFYERYYRFDTDKIMNDIC